MIASFKHKGLKELVDTGSSRRVSPVLHQRARICLNLLNAIGSLRDIPAAGLKPHPLRGQPNRYALSVSGPWRITFGWDRENVTAVDLEQYH